MNIPVGRCDQYGEATWDRPAIGQKCSRHCTGGMFAATRKGDWRQCDTCLGHGRTNIIRCQRCDGVGWLYARGRTPT